MLKRARIVNPRVTWLERPGLVGLPRTRFGLQRGVRLLQEREASARQLARLLKQPGIQQALKQGRVPSALRSRKFWDLYREKFGFFGDISPAIIGPAVAIEVGSKYQMVPPLKPEELGVGAALAGLSMFITWGVPAVRAGRVKAREDFSFKGRTKTRLRKLSGLDQKQVRLAARALEQKANNMEQIRLEMLKKLKAKQAAR